MEKLFVRDQKLRKYMKLLKESNIENKKQKLDSVWTIQKNIDSINTEVLIKITKKYGFPSVARTGGQFPVFLIFRHSLKYHNKKIEKLVSKI